MTFYKKRRIYILVIVLVLLIAFELLIKVKSMNKAVIVDDTSDILFSKESGFYDDEFDLELYSSKGTIYYTLDGSEPDNNSILYTGPIHINDASNNENVHSARTDVSTGFYVDLINEYSTADPCYEVPCELVDKATIVRAVVYYDSQDIYSDIKTKSYFVGYNSKDLYDNVKVISIVTDPNNLFSYYSGLYVTGANFDEFANERLGTSSKTPYWWWWTSNYSRGYSSEKEATVQMFNEDGNLVFSQNCGINIHGGGSRGKNQKSFNLFARNKYSQYDHFMFDFFDNGYFPKRVTLTQGGDDDLIKFKDYFINKTCKNLNFATMNFVPCVLFLDGEYWGFYWLTDKYDESYFQYYYNVEPDNIIFVKNGSIEEGTEADFDDYQEMMDFCSTADFSDPQNVEKLYDLIDVDSFIDYFATMIYMGRYNDWPMNDQNVGMWRARNASIGSYNDGRWRWAVFDVNSGALTENLIQTDTFDTTLNYSFFSNIMKIDEIRNELLNRIIELGESTFNDKVVEREVYLFNDLYKPELLKSIKRFYVDDKVVFYDAYLSSTERFLLQRNDFVSQYYRFY